MFVTDTLVAIIRKVHTRAVFTRSRRFTYVALNFTVLSRVALLTLTLVTSPRSTNTHPLVFTRLVLTRVVIARIGSNSDVGLCVVISLDITEHVSLYLSGWGLRDE